MRERALRNPRFIADAHLGGLARLLRMAGFDTLYDNGWRDRTIVEIAAREKRIVLTRDRELLKRRSLTHGCYIHALQPALQLREIMNRLDLARSVRPFSLCLTCNAALQPIEKAAVADRLPPSVRDCQQRFTTCDVCHRIFWEGSHWRRMQQCVADAQAACMKAERTGDGA